MKKAIIAILWIVIIFHSYVDLAQAETDLDKTVCMKLLSYDFNESWMWGSYHESQNIVEAYTNMSESINQQIMENKKKWIKVLFRISLGLEECEEKDTATVIRVTDFEVDNANLLIFPRYTRLSESGDDLIELFPGKDNELLIYVEAIAFFDDQNIEILNQKIQSMAFWCNIEYQPDTFFRHKKRIKIDTQSAQREIKFCQSGITAEVTSVKNIGKTEDYQDILDQENFNLNKNYSVYEIVINFKKSMPYSIYCMRVISNYDFIQVFPTEDDSNESTYNIFDNNKTHSIRFFCIYKQDTEALFDEALAKIQKSFVLEFSTEFFGLNNMDGTPANGAYGIRFQVPVF